MDSVSIIELLIKLLADQEAVHINYRIEEVEREVIPTSA